MGDDGVWETLGGEVTVAPRQSALLIYNLITRLPAAAAAALHSPAHTVRGSGNYWEAVEDTGRGER